MANTYTTLSALFTGIADSIRNKKNSVDTIIADNFPSEIENLRTGFDYNNSNVTSIADYQFKNCEDLNSVDCNNLISIGTGAFENCTNLKNVILYDSVENIGENAFNGCENLTIYCHMDSKPDSWNNNWNCGCEVVWMIVETWDISATENDSVTAKLSNDINNNGMYSLTISGNGNMSNYTNSTMPWYNYKENISSVIIYSNVANIGNYAFYQCKNLTSIIIPDSITGIGYGTFSGCSSLTSIIIPDSVTSIGNSAFSGCSSLTSIIIPDGVTSISGNAFSGCSSLTSIIIPDNVTNIGDNAFYRCSSLTSITYTGTISQWNAITFGTNWNYNTGNYTIYCTDGTIAKS